ncbi:MAG: hypothetical protein K6U74_06380 [Firmicutes bacterium]|nr:hypothetical protein [Bacillota bacterium]
MIIKSMRYIFILWLLILHKTAYSQVNLPVTNGPSPTCLGQMYSDILWASGYLANGSYDPNAPTQFANSNEGVLGLTIFFEVRPYGYANVYNSSAYGHGGSDAMAGVAATAINRSNTNNIDVSNAPGNPWLTLATKDMSPSIWNVNKQATGGLKSGMYNTLINILNGAPQTQDCNGLMYSWAMAIAACAAHSCGILRTPQPADPTNYFPKTLFFNTDGSTPSVSPSRVNNLQRLGLANAPRYPSGAYSWYFWTITDATSYPGYPAAPLLY